MSLPHRSDVVFGAKITQRVEADERKWWESVIERITGWQRVFRLHEDDRGLRFWRREWERL